MPDDVPEKEIDEIMAAIEARADEVAAGRELGQPWRPTPEQLKIDMSLVSTMVSSICKGVTCLEEGRFVAIMIRAAFDYWFREGGQQHGQR